MKFFVFKNGCVVGTVYAPNYSSAFDRAVKEYGLDIEVEES